MHPSSASPRQTVAVVGLGSIGGVIAGALRAADRHDVLACVRTSIDHLTVERPDGVVRTPLRTITDPAQATPVDWVLLSTKVQDVPKSASWLAALCTPNTRVAVLQNGIGHVERLTPLVGGATIVPTIVYYNSERLAADHVRMRPADSQEFAVRDDADGHAFAELLHGAPMRTLVSADFLTLAWRKLLLNVIANPITALAMERMTVLRRDDVQALCMETLHEAVAVGRAEGAQLPDDAADQALATILSYPAEAGTSMYFDRLAGRPLEIEALTGAVVAAGRKHGIPTPVNNTMFTLLRAVHDAHVAASR
ncbi:MAG TPA: 2-dehydropantoate 2-reductase [Gemmatimonas sp.]|uniref:2-dehydropantoate 2-reductase n=1 Tax=Gemmatimonas sp. TaxID=1962908 RepID=UPI002EDA93AB